MHDDWMLSLICDVALGRSLDWDEISVSGDECTQSDRDRLDAMSVDEARKIVLDAIRNGRG